jgi:hypothetical protein
LLLTVIPIIDAIVLLIFMALDSQPEPNEYGSNQRRRRPEGRIGDDCSRQRCPAACADGIASLDRP